MLPKQTQIPMTMEQVILKLFDFAILRGNLVNYLQSERN